MIIGVVAKQGAGKTQAITMLGAFFALKIKVPLYANYHILKIPFEYIERSDQLWKIENGIFLFDEIWVSMDSRNWESKKQTYLTQFIQQMRKKRIVCFYTSQHISQVEKRIRLATDYLVYCEQKPNGFWLNFIDYQYQTLCRRFLIRDPSPVWELYDTYEVIKPLV